MKKLFALFILFVAFSSALLRGQSTDLFISEWLDGSGGHQAIEIFNGTGAPVNMMDYSLKLSEKYLGWATDTTTGFVNPDTTLIWNFPNKVLANDSVYAITIVTATRTGWIPKADTVTAATSTNRGGQIFQGWNGEDAIGLFKSNVLIDQVGPELSVNDTFWVAGVSSAGCDHTLVRKSTIFTGNTNWETSAGTDANNSEWIVAAKNVVTYWGTHRMYRRGTDILSFSIPQQTGPAVIDAAGHTVTIEVAVGTSVTELVPTITVSDSADISPISGVSADFTNPVSYLVTSEAGTTQNWIVTVNVKKNTDATLSNLKVDGVDVAGFSADKVHYYVTLTQGTTIIPIVSATAADSNASVLVTQSSAVSGNAVVLVKAEEVTVTKTYTVHFTIDPGYDLIISEYIDGSSGAQALELFNGTGATVNLKNYSMKLSSSGAGWAWNTTTMTIDSLFILPLGDINLAHDSVYVICNNATTRPGFRENADLFLTTTNLTAGSKLVAYNGNDAVGLFKNDILIDMVGQEQGLGSTSFNAAGCTDPTPAGEDHTLLRKGTVLKGNTDWTSSGGTSAENSEWIVKPKNDASNLGFHNMFSIETDILTFSLPEQGKAAEIDVFSHTVNIEVVFGTTLTALNPAITISEGAQISPSGAQDFTNPVSYIVTAENTNYTQVWTVTVLMGAEPSHEAAITGFVLPGETEVSEINTSENTIISHVAWNADKTGLTPVITISAGATIDTSGIMDFTSPVVYVVTAQDKTTSVSWTVTVVNDPEPSHEAQILSFELTELVEPVLIGEISGKIIGELKPRTDATSLTPIITVSEGASISPVTSQDFSQAVTYTVTAEDGTTVKDWIVTLTVQPTPIVSINSIQYTTNASGDSPEKGKFVKTIGIVTGVTSNSFFMQTGDGGWNGIMVKTNIAPGVAVGDTVTVEGTVKEDGNLTIITIPYLLVEVQSSGNAVPNPVIVAISDFTEAYEGVLVTLKNLICTDISGLSEYKEWQVKDGNTTIYVDDDLYFQTASLNEYFSSITGIGTYALDYFRLLPRSAGDVATSISDTESGRINIYPNPFSGTISVTNLKSISKIIISNALGQSVRTIDQITTEMHINASSLSKGMYFITLESENGSRNTKLIIKE